MSQRVRIIVRAEIAEADLPLRTGPAVLEPASSPGRQALRPMASAEELLLGGRLETEQIRRRHSPGKAPRQVQNTPVVVLGTPPVACLLLQHDELRERLGKIRLEIEGAAQGC